MPSTYSRSSAVWLLSRSVVITLLLFYTLRSTQPIHPVLRKLLDPRLQLCFVQVEVINRPDPHDELSSETAADSVHQRSARGAEIVCHSVAGIARLVLSELGELLLAPNVFDGSFIDDEVRSEHGRRDLAAIGTVADEGVYEIIAFGRLSGR